MPTEHEELVALLTDANPKVRVIASEQVLVFTASDEGKAALKGTKVCEQLCQLVGDVSVS